MHSRQKSIISFVVGLGVSLGFLVTAAHAQSGVLDPPGSAVDGSGNPVPTTQTQPSWDQTLPAAERFVLVMGGAAVLDKETGLVWEQSPLTTTLTWSNARFQCIRQVVGGRRGWRLSSVHELASLVDPFVGPPGPTLPPGHPFSNVQGIDYWSATALADDPTRAWSVFLRDGTVTASNKAFNFHVWCVRGGGPLSEY